MKKSNNQRWPSEWRGYTYCWPSWRLTLWLWRVIFCKRGWHLWDEVMSWAYVKEHYLSCDACGCAIGIHPLQEP